MLDTGCRMLDATAGLTPVLHVKCRGIGSSIQHLSRLTERGISVITFREHNRVTPLECSRLGRRATVDGEFQIAG
jgi:hypothetical protein